MSDTPLIWTSKGNVPIDSLTYKHGWVDTEKYIAFEERWYDATGELVKNNTHAYAKSGLVMGGEQAVMA
jgi:hypothetical protein